jgi:hypothetical protein
MHELIEQSPFANSHGGLDLVRKEDGSLYLRMEGDIQDRYFGPLTEEQLSAFKLLCMVPEA